MDQHRSYDFEPVAPESARSGRGRGIFLSVLFLTALVVAAGAGYGLARGAWTLPASIAAQIPAPLAPWLPLSLRPSRSAGSPAELKDYAFELLKGEMKQGEAVVDIRLVDKGSGKPVPDAVVFATRIDMAPEGMPTMTSPLEPQPSPQPGVYRFKTDLTMEGGWQLSLAAKVQGETGTVQNRLVLKAVP